MSIEFTEAAAISGYIRQIGWHGLLAALFIAPMLTGCAAAFPQVIDSKPMRFEAKPATVFVADGAGGFQFTSKTLHNVLERDGYPIDVVTFQWSHGNNRIYADQTDYAYARMQGRRLAEIVLAHRVANPNRPTFLAGHSAGSLVVLTAVETLPPGTIEDLILLSPSLSYKYDLREALRRVAHGVHVHYSPHDYIYLGLATRLIGTSDRLRTKSAGRVGFGDRFFAADPESQHKLRQHPWTPKDRALGHNGGHFGTYAPNYLREYIFPLFDPARVRRIRNEAATVESEPRAK